MKILLQKDSEGVFMHGLLNFTFLDTKWRILPTSFIISSFRGCFNEFPTSYRVYWSIKMSEDTQIAVAGPKGIKTHLALQLLSAQPSRQSACTDFTKCMSCLRLLLYKQLYKNRRSRASIPWFKRTSEQEEETIQGPVSNVETWLYHHAHWLK